MRFVSALLAGSIAACAPSPPTHAVRAPAAPAAQSAPIAAATTTEAGSAACPVQKQLRLREAPEQIEPEQRVPDFRLATQSCQIIDSQELVGKKPFVVVFFASWCDVCEHKIPIVQEALLERSNELTPLFVSLDEADGWSGTEDFLVRHGLVPEAAVAGREFLGFSFGYNPFRSVPVVVVVGRSGRIVDVQIGSRHGDDYRLGQALDMAIEEQPEQLVTSYPPR
jgi:thiol-disulfide isomerase/thioredoxin